MKVSWWIAIVIVTSSLPSCSTSTNFSTVPLDAKRLDVCLGDCLNRYTYQVGDYDVVLEVKAMVSGDNGRAEIAVLVNDSPEEILESYFDYDLWSDEPAGYITWRWVDDDSKRDLVIHLTTEEEYVVGSQDGKLTKLE